MKKFPEFMYSDLKFYIPFSKSKFNYSYLRVEQDNPTIYYVCNTSSLHPYCPGERFYYTCRKIDSTNHYIYQTQIWCQEDIDKTIPLDLAKHETHDLFYRNDFADILVIVVILFTILIIIPLKIISKIFGKWLKI